MRWQLSVAAAFMALCMWDCGGPNGLRFGLPGIEDAGTATAPQCGGNACSDVTIAPANPGYTISNKGSKTVIVSVRWAFGWAGCMDPSDTTLGAGQAKTYGNGSFCYPYNANYAPSGVVAPPPAQEPVRISSFTITPETKSAGSSAVFRVVLEKPAPPGALQSDSAA